MLLARQHPPARFYRMMFRIINWVLVFLTVECVSRLIFSPYMPSTAGTDVSDSFYRYKASLFFFDSNFVGIEILCLLAIMFAFKEEIGRKQMAAGLLSSLCDFVQGIHRRRPMPACHLQIVALAGVGALWTSGGSGYCHLPSIRELHNAGVGSDTRYGREPCH
jgi:hypothetical protein